MRRQAFVVMGVAAVAFLSGLMAASVPRVHGRTGPVADDLRAATFTRAVSESRVGRSLTFDHNRPFLLNLRKPGGETFKTIKIITCTYQPMNRERGPIGDQVLWPYIGVDYSKLTGETSLLMLEFLAKLPPADLEGREKKLRPNDPVDQQLLNRLRNKMGIGTIVITIEDETGITTLDPIDVEETIYDPCGF